MPSARSPLVFVHSSDELYGADRILLDIHTSLSEDDRSRAEFWLPTDVPHGTAPLCTELEARGAVVRHLELPVLRRAYRSPRALLRLLRRLWLLSRELRRRRPELVYFTTSAMFLGAPVARLSGRARLVGHVQEIWGPGESRVLGPLARSLHQLIAISGPVRDALPPGIQPRTQVVLNATADPGRHTPLDGRSGPLRFLVASRWNGWKGHRTLLDAWERAGSPGKLLVLGGPPSSGEIVDVPELVRGLSRPDTVEIIGEVPDIAPWLEQADVMLVPSDKPEPFGLVAIEAFARGRPVVGSRGGGLAEIIDDGKTGWMYAAGEAAALAEVLSALSRERVTQAGAEARRTYEERFTTERFARDWITVVGLRD